MAVPPKSTLVRAAAAALPATALDEVLSGLNGLADDLDAVASGNLEERDRVREVHAKLLRLRDALARMPIRDRARETVTHQGGQ